MCPDNPELQYRAEFPVHFPLSVLIDCFRSDEGKCTGNYAPCGFSRKFLFFFAPAATPTFSISYMQVKY